MIHEPYIQRCIDLALKGSGHVSPNPLVGCVIVHEGRIIGEGWHRQYGEAHAEVNAIADAENRYGSEILKTSSLYVSLEPCAHYGKTPPCADLIISRQIPRVYIGCRDSYTEVNGKGIDKLKAAGIEVQAGILEAECRELNKRFFTFHEQQRPYIILKWAETADGYIAGTEKDHKQISGDAAQLMLHKWRSEEDAFMVGTHTLESDNPRLTTRLWQGKNPVRISIDRTLRLSHNLHFFNGESKSILFYHSGDTGNIPDHVQHIKLEELGIKAMLDELCKLRIQSLVVEGGAVLLQSFIDSGLWDESRIFKSKHIQFERGLKAPKIKAQQVFSSDLGDDTLSVSRHYIQH